MQDNSSSEYIYQNDIIDSSGHCMDFYLKSLKAQASIWINLHFLDRLSRAYWRVKNLFWYFVGLRMRRLIETLSFKCLSILIWPFFNQCVCLMVTIISVLLPPCWDRLRLQAVMQCIVKRHPDRGLQMPGFPGSSSVFRSQGPIMKQWNICLCFSTPGNRRAAASTSHVSVESQTNPTRQWRQRTN